MAGSDIPLSRGPSTATSYMQKQLLLSSPSVCTCSLQSVPHEAIICGGVKLVYTFLHLNCPVVIFTLRLKLNSPPASQALRHQAPVASTTQLTKVSHQAWEQGVSSLWNMATASVDLEYHCFLFLRWSLLLHCLVFTG